MRDFVREYLSYCRAEKGLSANSIEGYGNDLGRLSAWTEKNGLKMAELSKIDLREWLIDLSAKGLKETSKRRVLSSIRGFYKYLTFEGHIKNNPAEDLDSPAKSLYLPRFLNRLEIERLLETPDISTEFGLRDRTILELMYACGLRVSEAANLRFRDIDTRTGILTTTGKGSKTRRVPVGKSAIEWLEKYLILRRKRENIDIDNIFVNSHGAPITRRTIYLFITEYAEKCGFSGVSPHTLRHSFATHMIQNDADIRSVQQMLGHSDISTTQIYTHITSTQLKRNYERFHPRSRSSKDSE